MRVVERGRTCPGEIQSRICKGRTAHPVADAVFAAVKALVKEGKFEEAEQLALDTVGCWPEDEGVRRTAALVLAWCARLPEAQDLLESASEPESVLLRSAMLFLTGKEEQARKCFSLLEEGARPSWEYVLRLAEEISSSIRVRFWR